MVFFFNFRPFFPKISFGSRTLLVVIAPFLYLLAANLFLNLSKIQQKGLFSISSIQIVLYQFHLNPGIQSFNSYEHLPWFLAQIAALYATDEVPKDVFHSSTDACWKEDDVIEKVDYSLVVDRDASFFDPYWTILLSISVSPPAVYRSPIYGFRVRYHSFDP